MFAEHIYLLIIILIFKCYVMFKIGRIISKYLIKRKISIFAKCNVGVLCMQNIN